MFGFLYLVINATLIAIPIATVPFQYTTPLWGCANFSAYLDPLLPLGIASVYTISSGALSMPPLNPYPTPKYVSGVACGDFLAMRIDKWRQLNPLTPLSIEREDSTYLHLPYEINTTAIVRVKSLTPPSVRGDFVYRVKTHTSRDVYIDEYVVYGYAQISAYGLANVTYISLDSQKPDFYIYVPTPGVEVEGLRQWEPDVNFWISPNQTTGVGRPRVIVKQVDVLVFGECGGTAVALNPLERPIQLYVKLNTGETYVVSLYYMPREITTWRFRGAVAKTADGLDLQPDRVFSEDVSIHMCVVDGVSYYVEVAGYKYPARVRGGWVEAYTDLVMPRISLDDPRFNVTVSPAVLRIGENVTLQIYYGGVQIAEIKKRAESSIRVNTTAFFREVKVVDLLGAPLPKFTAYVGVLKFEGSDGVVRVIPLRNTVTIETHGVRYIAALDDEVRVPTLAWGSFVKIIAAAAIVGTAAALGLRKRREEIKSEETVVV